MLVVCALGKVASVSFVGATWRKSTNPQIWPPRSGHTAATDEQGRVWLFGGYVEEEGVPRRVTNDLWCLDPIVGWLMIQGEARSPGRPGPRLCSASCFCNGKFYLFAGWDPERPGTGGSILEDVWCLDVESLVWMHLGAMPRGPVSRHVAVSLPNGDIVVHTFRCIDSVLLFRGNEWIIQPTTGLAPSSRGLHSAAAVGTDVVTFGGADKSGQMRADAFVLDTRTWTWRSIDSDTGPTPRAGSCASSLGDDVFILCCGAERDPDRGDLVPRADVWALRTTTGEWTNLIDDAASSFRPRNAATLCGPLLSTAVEVPTTTFVLHGGWHPFRETYCDTIYFDIQTLPEGYEPPV